MTNQTTEISLIPNTEIVEETWDFDDYRHGLCRHAQIGTPRVDAGKARRLARAHAGAAIHTLALIASQTKDIPSALKAINMLLERGFGRADAPDAELPTEAPQPGALPAPSWLNPDKRLRYQAGDQEPSEVESSPEPARAPSSAPSATRDRPAPLLHAVPPPAPAPPAFWDGPGRPAQGSHREPV